MKRISNMSELEAQTSIEKFCREALGLDFPEVTGLGVSVPCPIPHAHGNDAELVIYRNGRIRCSAQKKPMTIWDLAMEAEGLNFREAVERVCEFFGIIDQIQMD